MGLRKSPSRSEKSEARAAVRGLQPSSMPGLSMSRRPLLAHDERFDFDLEDGRRLELCSVIGSGSGSTVYRAVIESPHGLRRSVAAKSFGIVSTDEADSVFDAIADAAQTSALVQHPNVVATLDSLVCERQPLVLLELVEGVDLRVLMDRYTERRRRMPLELAVFIALEVAEGLSGARNARGPDGMHLGLLHLGLTPREILLSWRGEVKVEGFGLDVARVGSSSVRSLRGVAGRAGMMAPEVACGVRGDARADVFSIGMLLRELLVGPRFPTGLSNAESIRRARDGYIQPITFAPDLPIDLAQTMTRALSIEPESRYPNASAMAFDLRRVALSLGVGDCRYFLRQALDREVREGLEGDTQEVLLVEDLD
jgi:eukaryotic-like serine/threonine-protein kinase